MKFVNLDESEIIEQPLEKVIARPDYSPVEFVYDDLCSLDSVSVDGIHPSGDDPDLILSPSINKINNCFKSEYFKISNLFSEIQTYEQKQEALKNLGLLDAINNSSYIHDLGRFDKQVDAEKAAVKVANDSNIVIMLYYIGSQNGIILQQVGDTITKQILLWDNTIFQRHINFSDSSKTQVSSTSYWWKLGATHISYDPDTRKFHLQDMNYKNLNPTVDSEIPLASLTTDGFMSKELAQKLEDSLSIKDLGTNILPHVATGNIITYVKDNNIKETVLFKYIDTDGSSTLGVCISRINDIGWIIYLVARKGIERLVFNSNGVREEWNEYGGVLRHNLDSVADEQLECLSVKGVKSLLSTKLDALSPGDGITMMNNTVSTLIGNGLTYNGREIVIDHDLTLKTNNGKLGVNAGDGLYVNPDNELGINVGKGLTINHTDSTVEVAKEILEEIDSKAPLEGYAPNLKVRFSDGLVGRIETIPHEIGRIAPTAGISVDDNSATIEKIKGESVVWNQLIDECTNKENFEGVTTYYDSTTSEFVIKNLSRESNYISGSLRGQITPKYQFVLGHTYYLYSNVNVNGIGVVDPVQLHTVILSNTITKNTQTSDQPICLRLTKDFPFSEVCPVGSEFRFKMVLYDLTLMFGAGNEPTTIEEFEARKPLGVTNDYNEGTIVSFQGGDIKSVGFNAFDEKWEVGSLNSISGENKEGSNFKRNVNYIRLAKNTTYECVYQNGTADAVWIMFYDLDGTPITHPVGDLQTNNLSRVKNQTFVTPNQECKVKFYTKNETNSQVCIHLVHSGYRNGDYEPYVEDIHPLPDIKSIKDNNGDVLFPYGLLSAGSVCDEITATKAIKRIGVVDMGTLTWFISETTTPDKSSTYNFLYTTKTVSPIGQALKAVALNPKYIWVETKALNVRELSDKTFMFSGGSLYLRDNYYTSAPDFKQAMQGVLLYYELAEPIEVDLEEPLNMTYDAWDFGTEELVVSEPSTSLKGEIIYCFNAVDRIRENSRNITTETERAKLAEETNSDAIAVEKARAEAKELELTNTITDETNARIASDKTITDTIGEVETGKTLVEMIKAAEAAAIAAATVVAEDSEFITIEQTGEIGKTQTYTIKTQDIASIGDLAAEISRAQEAEQGNSDAINSIKSDYLKSSDKLELSQAIVSETEARILAISNLEFKNSLKLDGVVLSEELLTTLSDVQSGALYSVGPDSNNQYKLYAYVNGSWTYMGYLNSSSIDITQSLGLSLNLAISQKAVTDALTPIIMTLAEFDALVSNGTITDDDLTIRYIID